MMVSTESQLDRAERVHSRRNVLMAGVGAMGTAALGATLISSPPAGATVKTYNGILLDEGGAVFNVMASAYGATGNGTTDDTSAIQSAITAASAAGGTVYFPAGTYKITSTLTVSGTGQAVRLVGASRGASIIELDMATGDGLRILASWCDVEGLQFATFSGVTRTSGAYISNNDGSSHSAWFLNVSKCYFNGGWDCIRADGVGSTQAQDLFVGDCNFVSFANYGISLGLSVGIANVYISRCEMTCSITSQAHAGITLGNMSSGLYVSQVDMYSTGYGITINPPAGGNATGIFLDQVQCDSCTYNGLSANSESTSPGSIVGIFASNCWFSSNGNDGVELGYYGSSPVTDVQLVGCQMFHNGSSGVGVFLYASQVVISGCLISDNTDYGVLLTNGITDIAVTGSVIRNQGYGVLFYGSTYTRTFLSGNSLSGNTYKYNSLPSGVQDFGSV